MPLGKPLGIAPSRHSCRNSRCARAGPNRTRLISAACALPCVSGRHQLPGVLKFPGQVVIGDNERAHCRAQVSVAGGNRLIHRPHALHKIPEASRRQFACALAAIRALQVNFSCSGTGTIHSRHTVSNAAIITGPRNRPSSPNVASPPKMPTNANRNGKRAAPPTSVGQTK
jgi:hypothetical protein